MRAKEIIKVDVQDEYYNWLCSLVGVEYNNQNYKHLISALHNKEFCWFVPNDDNRAFEGKNLRERFVLESKYLYSSEYYDYLDTPCTMLELIIALAYRCESIMIDQNESIPMQDWFWKLITNIKLDGCTDEYYYNVGVIDYIDEILDRIINRTYHRNGRGGLFPLKKHKKDQRKVELWYQMSSYLVENYYTE